MILREQIKKYIKETKAIRCKYKKKKRSKDFTATSDNELICFEQNIEKLKF